MAVVKKNFEDKKQYYFKKDDIVTCFHCGHKNRRDNFGPTSEENLHLTCMEDFFSRAVQAAREGKDTSQYIDQVRNQQKKLDNCLTDRSDIN